MFINNIKVNNIYRAQTDEFVKHLILSVRDSKSFSLFSPDGDNDMLRISNKVFDHSPLLIAKTSGSSGIPKLVIYKHRALKENARAVLKIINEQYSSFDFHQLSLPLTHMAGIAQVFRSIVDGKKCIPCHYLNPIQGSSLVSLVPYMLKKLTSYPHILNLYKEKIIFLGGGIIDKKCLEIIQENNLKVLFSYAASEYGPTLGISTQKNWPIKFSPLKGVRWYRSETGQISLKTPYKAMAIFDKKLKLLHPKQIETTNDVGEVIEGNIILKGRNDHKFKSAGVLIDPSEVENKLEKRFNGQRICLLPVKDTARENIPILLIEDKEKMSLEKIKSFKYFVEKTLKREERPFEVYIIPNFYESHIKPNRAFLKSSLPRIRKDENVQNFNLR